MTDPEPDVLVDEVLLRVVHPRFLDRVAGQPQPTGEAFRPTDADDGRLSVDRLPLRSPEESAKARIEAGRQVFGVVGVACEEAASVDIPAYATPRDDNEAHADLDMRHADKDRRKLMRECLMGFARERSWLHIC